MKLYKPKTVDLNDLMKYYKLIFPIFYWACHLPASIDRRMTRLSFYLKNYIFLCFIMILTFFMCILHISHCGESNFFVAYLNVEIIFFSNILSIFIAISPIFFYYVNFNKLWMEINAMNHLILKRLNHKINYREFLHSFIKSAAFPPTLFLLKILYPTGTIPAQLRLSVLSVKLAILYIKYHAIFVIGVFFFIYKMFGKYVNFAYHLNQSNLVFSNINNVFDILKFYKEIHYKLWIISQEIDRFFGLSVAIFCGQTFFDVSYSVYFFFHYWEQDNISILKCISKFRMFLFLLFTFDDDDLNKMLILMKS